MILSGAVGRDTVDGRFALFDGLGWKNESMRVFRINGGGGTFWRLILGRLIWRGSMLYQSSGRVFVVDLDSKEYFWTLDLRTGRHR